MNLLSVFKRDKKIERQLSDLTRKLDEIEARLIVMMSVIGVSEPRPKWKENKQDTTKPRIIRHTDETESYKELPELKRPLQ